MGFYPVANLVDLYDGYLGACRVNQLALVVCQHNGRIFIFEDRCPHMDVPLSSGSIKGDAIVCKAHGIAFNLQSGKADGPLADMMCGLKFYDVEYEGNKVGVRL